MLHRILPLSSIRMSGEFGKMELDSLEGQLDTMAWQLNSMDIM